MVGEGPLGQDLENAARRLELGEHVRFIGRVSDADMQSLVSLADLFLNPTLYEGSSLVTLEAMSHGCAIVATRAGGIPDKIEEAVTGWLAEPGDAGSLAEAIRRWWRADEAAKAQVRAAAAQRCRQRFDWPRCVDRYVELIRALQARSAGARGRLTAASVASIGAVVLGADERNHLLWALLVENLESGREGHAALVGERVITYAELGAAVVTGAAEIDDQFAAGSRILVASRNQIHVAVGLLSALASRSMPLLVDPTSPERLRRTAREWGAAGGLGERAALEATGLPILDAARLEAWLEVPSALRGFAPRPVLGADPAFWTFTSGTTGEPRAVVHAHRGPRAAFEAFAVRVLGLGPEDVTIATAGLPFVYALGNALLLPLDGRRDGDSPG